MKLNQLKLGLRLGSGFGLVLLLSVGIAIAGWTRLSASHQSMVTAESMEHQASLAQQWEGLTRLNVARALAIAKANGNEQVNGYFAPQMKDTSAAITAILDELAPTVTSPEGKALLADIEARRAVYVKQRAAVMLKVVGQDPQANELLETQVLPAAQSYLAAIDKLQQFQTDLSKAQ
ncbi:MAG: mcp, partial [Rhizobacter sp.]|nr:mcp [Rhizobacter sp.]